MTSEYTSGPWVFHPQDGRAPDGYLPIFGPVKGKDGYTFYPRIASVGAVGGPPAANDPDGDYRARDEANARLIAAAPDLLAALQAVERKGYQGGCDACPCCEALKDEPHFACQLADAIAKALGQEAVSQ